MTSKLFKLTFLLLLLSLGISSKASAAEYTQGELPSIYITTKDNLQQSDGYAAADITLVDSQTGGTDTINEPAGQIKVRGNSTAEFKKKPYNIKLTTKTSVFGLPKGKKWCLLANYLDKTMLRNQLAFDFARKIGLNYTVESCFVDVYVNNTYRGVYQMTQNIRADKTSVDIDTDNNEFIIERERSRTADDVTYFETGVYGYRYKVDEPETPTDTQLAYLKAFITNTEKAISSGDIEQIEQYIDVDSFINFYILEELFKNLDFNTSSTRYYIKGGKLYAGPVWDFDLSCGNVSSTIEEGFCDYCNGIWTDSTTGTKTFYGDGNYDSTKGIWCFKGSWAKELITCPKFANKLYSRLTELQPQIINLYTANTLGTSQIDTLVSTYESSFTNDLAIWPIIAGSNNTYNRIADETYNANVDFLKTWLEQRNIWFLSYAKSMTVEETDSNDTIDTNTVKVTTGKVSSVTLKNNKPKTMAVSWKKISGAKGYEVRYSLKSNMKSAKTIKATTSKTTLKKLTKGKKYYVQVRAYKLNSSKTKVYGSWSKTANIKIKK